MTSSKLILETITKEEASLFDILTNAAVLSSKDVTVRIAGGWLRDKLLGQSSLDIDVCLDTCTGEEFAMLVKEYLAQIEGKSGEHHNCSRVSVIKANPDKSKHLETATMTIDSNECDFVNLRAEVYNDDESRIPSSVSFGTPKEDAFRRDFTVNSLFYNLQSKQIEDWTGKGIDDMKNKIIRTPLNPSITFRDDPLRLLRAVRFAARCKFHLAEDLRSAASSNDVRSALMKKVSRERVGKELEGILTGKDAKPGVAFNLISDLGLQDLIFSFPEVSLLGNVNSLFTANEASLKIGKRMFSFSDYDKRSSIDEDDGNPLEPRFSSMLSETTMKSGWSKSLETISLVPKAIELINTSVILLTESSCVSTIDTRLLYLGAYLLPFGEMAFNDKKGKTVPLVSHIIGTSLKYKKSDTNDISLIMDNCRDFKQLITKLRLLRVRPSRLTLGLLLKRLKSTWPECLVLSAIADYLSNVESSVNNLSSNFNLCRDMYKHIIELKLDGCWKLKPLLNGNGIGKALGLKNGPMIGMWVDEQFRWMLDNPYGSKDDCVKYLKQRQIQLEHSSEMDTTMNRLTLTASKRTASQASL